MDKPQLVITTIKEGDRVTYPRKGNHVRIHFQAFVLCVVQSQRPSGEKIETTKDNDHPFEFQLGVDDVIMGVQQIVTKMSIGEKVKAEIPANLAYQKDGLAGLVMPNERLIMEIELISITF